MQTILIVDDQSVSRQILRALVDPICKDHEIKTFACPQEALGWLDNNSVALVLTDYKMPVMNGIEFIRLFRGYPECKEIPVIMVSSDNDLGTRKMALDAGASDFMEKPVNHHEFRERCRTLLGMAS